ncbi:TraB/GumN family protein [Vibrio vulnificus]|nr:TraB/GumN family protein [Vibrio vulnificus]
MLRTLALLVTLFTFMPLALAAPMVWQATNAQTEFRIIGSIHVGSEAFYPLPSAIEAFIADSDALIIEADLSQLGQATYPVNRYVSQQVLTADQAQQLAVITQALQLPLEQLKVSPPWATALTIQMAQVEKMGYQAKHGVDVYLIEKAQRNGIPLHPLETAQFQIDLLSKTPQDGKELLISALEEFADSEALFACLVESWQQGDAKKLLEFARRSNISPELEKAMFTERNVDWANKLTQLSIDKPGRYSVVVGALHLVGEQNLLALLEQSGFKTQQLTQSQPAQCHF